MQSNSSIILPDGARSDAGPAEPSVELKARCDHQDMIYSFDEESGKYVCLCEALVEPQGEIKTHNHGMNADGTFATKVVMKEIIPPPPILEQRFYQRGPFTVTETIVVAGAAERAMVPRFVTILEIRDGQAVARSKPTILDADSVEEAFDLIPAIYMSLRPGARKAILNARLTGGVAEVAAGMKNANRQRPHIAQRNERSR